VSEAPAAEAAALGRRRRFVYNWFFLALFLTIAYGATRELHAPLAREIFFSLNAVVIDTGEVVAKREHKLVDPPRDFSDIDYRLSYRYRVPGEPQPFMRERRVDSVTYGDYSPGDSISVRYNRESPSESELAAYGTLSLNVAFQAGLRLFLALLVATLAAKALTHLAVRPDTGLGAAPADSPTGEPPRWVGPLSAAVLLAAIGGLVAHLVLQLRP
jgi:hypothetical protein